MIRCLTLLASLLFFGANAAKAAEPSARPDGARLYAQRCSACHGADGRGGVGVPLALPAFLSSVDDAYLRKTLRLGRPGRVMPAFTQLADAELKSIIAHIRSWPGQKPPKTAPQDRIAGNAARGQDALYAPLRRLPWRPRRRRARHRCHPVATAQRADSGPVPE